MLSTLLNWDAVLAYWASNLTAQSSALQVAVYVAADVLILLFPVMLLALWYRPELRSEKHAARKAVIMAVMGAVVVLAGKTLMSLVFLRDRPFVAHPDAFHLVMSVDPPSFPSGHTMVAVVIAASLIWSGFRKLGWILAGLAALVGLGRVFAGVHYPSDVLGGAILAMAVAWYLHREASSLKRYLPDT